MPVNAPRTAPPPAPPAPAPSADDSDLQEFTGSRGSRIAIIGNRVQGQGAAYTSQVHTQSIEDDTGRQAAAAAGAIATRTTALSGPNVPAQGPGVDHRAVRSSSPQMQALIDAYQAWRQQVTAQSDAIGRPYILARQALEATLVKIDDQLSKSAGEKFFGSIGSLIADGFAAYATGGGSLVASLKQRLSATLGSDSDLQRARDAVMAEHTRISTAQRAAQPRIPADLADGAPVGAYVENYAASGARLSEIAGTYNPPDWLGFLAAIEVL